MGESITLDRHVLASPATAYDTAWSTYGVTPGARSRSGRLEEEVPWGTHVTRAADPPRLSGSAGTVLEASNLDRLGQAVLPVEGWLGFSLWGAVGDGAAQDERRVLTHTLLLTGDAFRRIEGHPWGLLREGGVPAGWVRELTEESDFAEPVALEPVRVAVDRGARAELARARVGELLRLRDAVLPMVGGDPERLRGVLAAMYEALARTVGGDGGEPGDRGGRPRHVVVRGVGAATSTLLRLVWLSLPLEDRVGISFVTEQRRTERPRARLLGLPEAEWGRYVPDGSWVLGEDRPWDAAPGRAYWAGLVADPGFPDGFRRVDGLARRHGWRLVGGGDLDAEAGRERWRRDWRRDGATVEGVRRLWTVESGRPGGPRGRAVGVALGRSASRAPEPGARERAVGSAVELLAGLPAAPRRAVLRGAVRELRRAGREGRLRAALLRCRAAAGGDEVAQAELPRLVDRDSDALRALLADPGGGGGLELVLAAAPAAVRGDPVGRELARVGAAETRWTPERAEVLVDGVPGSRAGTELLGELLAAVVEEGRGADGMDALAGKVIPRLDPGALRTLAEGLAAAPPAAGADGPDAGAMVAVTSRLLPALAAVAGPGDDGIGTALVERLAATRPPALDPGAWRVLVADAPSAWLARPPVLAAFAEALAAGRRPFAAAAPGEAHGVLAGELARRVLEAAGVDGLGGERADAVLRLLWSAGGEGALDALGGRREVEVPVLVELLAHPAPVPLFHRIRRRLVSRLEEAPSDLRPAGPVDRLAAYAPAVAARLVPRRRESRVLVGGGT